MKLRKLLAAALSLTVMCGAASTAANTAMAASLSAGTLVSAADRQADESAYVGRWVAKTISTDGSTSDYGPRIFYFDFESGGTGSVTVYDPGENPDSSPVTWSADGNNLSIVEHYNGSDYTYTAYFSDNMLSITSDSTTVYFAKDDSGDVEPVVSTDPETYEDGFITFEIYSDHAVFKSCSRDAEGEIAVPSEVKGLPVTEVASEAFRFCKQVTAVNIPDSVTGIGVSLFTYDHALVQATVDEANPNFCSVDGVIFSKDLKTLVAFPPAYEQKDYVIPDGVEMIREDSFYTAEIETLTMPDSVNTIDSFAICYCKYLKSIKFSDSLTEINSYAFSNCKALENADIPASVTSIGRNAFNDCEALAKITVNNSQCMIYDSEYTLGSNDVTVIRGHADSTAHAYAAEYAYQFEDMDGNVLVTSTASGETTSTTTTTTATAAASTTEAGGTTTASTAYVQTTTAASTTSTKAPATTTTNTPSSTTKAPSSTTTTVVSTTETAPVTTTTASNSDSRFVGKWQMTGFTDEDGGQSDKYNGVTVYAIFHADGTGSIEYYSAGEEPDIENITWSGEDDKITAVITIDEEEYELEFIYADNELAFQRTDGTLHFAKVVLAVVLGDPTQDGAVDAKDASAILVEYAKLSTGGASTFTEEKRAAADANSDGVVDAKDASLVLAYYSYLSTGGTDSFPTFLSSKAANK